MSDSRMTRRQACRTLLAGATAISLPRCLPAGSPAKPFHLNYILASSMYGTLPLAEILPAVKKTGAECIDIWPRVHANQREQIEKMGHTAFRDLLKQHHAKLGMTTRYDLGPFKLDEEIKFVHKFDGRLIVCGAKPAEGKTLRDQVKSFVKRLDPTLAVAKEHGVTIGIENHGNSLVESPDSLRYLAEFAGERPLGVALAPYHLPQNEEQLARLIEDLGPKLVHFYAWQHGEGCMKKMPKELEMKQMPGRGPLEFAPLLAALQSINYTGWTEIFMHPVPRGIPILKTAQAVTNAINESRKYLEESLPQTT